MSERPVKSPSIYDQIQEAAGHISSGARVAAPRVAIVLGTGLGGVARTI
jgi:hypothetical protein